MSNVIKIEATPKTPKVIFDPSAGVVEIRGRSIPENSVEFYKPIMDALEKYEKSPKPETIVHVQLEYFNTASSKCILDFFKKLEEMNNKVTKVTINWYYEEDDEDMQEAGEDYQTIVNLPFKMHIAQE
jgi:hypothetical protein